MRAFPHLRRAGHFRGLLSFTSYGRVGARSASATKVCGRRDCNRTVLLRSERAVALTNCLVETAS